MSLVTDCWRMAMTISMTRETGKHTLSNHPSSGCPTTCLPLHLHLSYLTFFWSSHLFACGREQDHPYLPGLIFSIVRYRGRILLRNSTNFRSSGPECSRVRNSHFQFRFPWRPVSVCTSPCDESYLTKLVAREQQTSMAHLQKQKRHGEIWWSLIWSGYLAKKHHDYPVLRRRSLEIQTTTLPVLMYTTNCTALMTFGRWWGTSTRQKEVWADYKPCTSFTALTLLDKVLCAMLTWVWYIGIGHRKSGRTFQMQLRHIFVGSGH